VPALSPLRRYDHVPKPIANRRLRTFLIPTILILALALVAAACGGDDDDGGTPTGTATPTATSTATPTPAAATTVDVALTEFAVNPAQDTVDAGTLTFSVANDGALPHNFRVIKTDLASDALPTANNLVDEGQVDVVASIADYAGGETEEVSVDLEPGSYVLICNVVGHYDLGMRAGFTVE
jgi:uncharacterized cupredoxin-like copper-binding protein